jgi:hypothetical protein
MAATGGSESCTSTSPTGSPERSSPHPPQWSRSPPTCPIAISFAATTAGSPGRSHDSPNGHERGPWSAGEAVPAEPHPEHQQDTTAQRSGGELPQCHCSGRDPPLRSRGSRLTDQQAKGKSGPDGHRRESPGHRVTAYQPKVSQPRNATPRPTGWTVSVSTKELSVGCACRGASA